MQSNGPLHQVNSTSSECMPIVIQTPIIPIFKCGWMPIIEQVCCCTLKLVYIFQCYTSLVWWFHIEYILCALYTPSFFNFVLFERYFIGQVAWNCPVTQLCINIYIPLTWDYSCHFPWLWLYGIHFLDLSWGILMSGNKQTA